MRWDTRSGEASWRLLIGCAISVLTGAACRAADAPPVGAPWSVERVPSVSATAFEPLLAGPLSLSTLSDYALRHNPATRVAWASALADVAGVDAARALLRPVVSASLPLTLAHGAAPDAADANAAASTPAAPGVTRSITPSVGLSWVLFDFGARASGVEAARWQAVASQLGYNRELQTVVANVEQAYFSLLGARQLEAALQIGVDAARSSLDAAQARRSAGLATIAETAQAEAALGQARLQQVQARATARSAAGTLANAIGVPVNLPLQLADDEGFSALSPATRLDDLLLTARVSRADLMALAAQVRQGEAEVAATEAQGRPSLALSAAVARHWGNEGKNGATQQVALTLSIPIFDGGLVRAQTQAARARLQSVVAQREQQRQAVDLDVWQAYQQADSSEAAVATAEALLRSATVAEEAARERYRSGVGLLLELLSAQSTAVQARASLVQARYDGQLAITRLGYAVGSGIHP